MKKEHFILGDYELEVDGVLVKIKKDAISEETVAYANKILELYLSKKSEVIDYILNDRLLDFYGGMYTKDEIVKKLKDADIEIISESLGTLIWLNHELDEHIIEAEFNHDLQ